MEVKNNFGGESKFAFPAAGIWPSSSGASCLTVVCVQAVVSGAPTIL